MKLLRLLTFFFAVFTLPNKAYAIYSEWLVDWPVVSTTGATRFTLLNVQPIGPAPESITCSLFNRCRLKLNYGYGNNVWTSEPLRVLGTNMSYRQFYQKLNEELPISGAFYGYQEDRCLELEVVIASGISANYVASTCSDGKGSITPPEPPTPPVVTCRLDGDVTLRHGSLAPANISGNMASGYSMLSCSGAASARVRAVNNAGSSLLSLAADNSLFSELKVNGSDGNKGAVIKVPNQATVIPVLFTSTLQRNGTARSGDFSGSAMALVTID
ncbi:MrpH family fimbial adhesin [Serratia marcescens]|uniref:MrpH family fimbial adhesin n=1 Tax=Serratia marcescens TaxID=615 RepID=UPI0034D40E4C